MGVSAEAAHPSRRSSSLSRPYNKMVTVVRCGMLRYRSGDASPDHDEVRQRSRLAERRPKDWFPLLYGKAPEGEDHIARSEARLRQDGDIGAVPCCPHHVPMKGNGANR